MRERFDQDWLFSADPSDSARFPETIDHSWLPVTLPHRERSYDGHAGQAAQSPVWYRKHFSLPAKFKGQQVYLRFEGEINQTKVWLNGHELADPTHGESSYEYDLTRRFNYGERQKNVIAIRHIHSGSSPADFPTGNVRGVWLNVRNPVHVLDTQIRVTQLTPGSRAIQVESEIVNHRESDAEILLQHAVLAADGTTLSHQSTPLQIKAGAHLDQSHQLFVEPDTLPAEPHRARITIIESDQVIDEVETPLDRGSSLGTASLNNR